MNKKRTRGLRPVSLPVCITELSIKNFRGFRRLRKLPMKPLTFLVGPNSSGKSSIAASLMLISQSNFFRLSPRRPTWNGRLIDLGSYEDTVFRHNAGLPIDVNFTLKLMVSSREIRPFEIHYRFRRGSDPSGMLRSIVLSDLPTGVSLQIQRNAGRYPTFRLSAAGKTDSWSPPSQLDTYDQDYEFTRVLRRFLRMTSSRRRSDRVGLRRLGWLVNSYQLYIAGSMQRVSSGRSGPKRWYPRGASARVDSDGNESLFETVDPQLIRSGRSLRRQGGVPTEEHLSKFLERLSIASAIDTQDTSAYHSSIMVTDSLTGVRSNLSDVGYGTSQALPVVRATLSAHLGALFIEQPEIHLHPKAQSELAEMIALVSRARQVLVETHSEHMINRARILVADGRLSASDVAIHYVDRDETGSYVTTIGIDERGDFTRDWPDGFFDERYNDTVTLTSLRGDRN